MVRSMASTDGTHNCHFTLEQNASGYFTGNFICTSCGRKVSQSQWFDSLTATSSGPRFIERSLKDSAWTKPLDISDCNATHPDCETVAKSGHILLLSDTL